MKTKAEQLAELKEATAALEAEIEAEQEKWKANEKHWSKLTDTPAYLKYKGYIHVSKVRTAGFGHSSKKTSKPKNFLYWNPDNHKQAWNGKGKTPDWIKVDMDEIDSHPRYIHRKHPRYDDLVSDHKHYGLVDK